MFLRKSTLDILALWLIPGLGPRRIKQIHDLYSPLQSVFTENPEKLSFKININAETARSIQSAKSSDTYKRELDLISRHHLKVIDFTQKEYPAFLKEVFNAPPILYVKGNESLNRKIPIAFVGSRKASYYGKSMCRKLIKQLASISNDICIISGLAIGIDKEAHSAALENGLKTIAVLASGLSDIYPVQNRKLAEQIIDHGALVTEFPVTSKPVAMNFPLRNRIISGLSKGIVIIEAGEKSGATITAGYAIEQNRELFALPGPADSHFYIGTNRLIQKGQAKLVLSAEDILDELNVQLQWVEPSIDTGMWKLDINVGDKESKILSAIADGVSRSEAIAQKTGLPINEVLTLLTGLELKGLVVKQPGALYALTR